MWHIYTMEYNSAIKKEWSVDSFYNLENTKWKKKKKKPPQKAMYWVTLFM